MNTDAKQKEHTYGIIKVLLYIISGLGLLNTISIFYPLLNISYIGAHIDFNIPDKPSLFNIIFDGIMSDSKYKVLFIVISIILIIAVLFSVILFISAILKINTAYILATIASSAFLLFSISVYVICILCFVNSHISFEIMNLIAFKISIIIPERIMLISIVNIVLALLIKHYKMRLTSSKL